jgi:3-phosphoshikimate 1-carboxyvinyltransferase
MRIHAAKSLKGIVRVPGDKSISHRALMLSALASGTSTITGLSHGEDVQATKQIVEQLGAATEVFEGQLRVIGPDQGLRASERELYCGNSGTTMRLLAGLLGGVSGRHVLTGDESLSRRPMNRVATPLRQMGLNIEGTGENTLAPLTIVSPASLQAISYVVPIVSSQVKSAILLAALFASGPSRVTENIRTRRHTEEMLQAAGILITITDSAEGRTIEIQPGRPMAHEWDIPADPSQAAFFVVLGIIHPEANIEIPHVYFAPERVGYLDVLRRMGADIDIDERNELADITVSSSVLRATSIHANEIPSVDEVPVLVVAACAAHGNTRFEAMGELRVKESDRFAQSIALARALGSTVTVSGDDFEVEGLGSAINFRSFSFAAELDHRMVMASAVAGIAGAGAELDDISTVASSYPGFFSDVDALK